MALPSRQHAIRSGLSLLVIAAVVLLAWTSAGHGVQAQPNVCLLNPSPAPPDTMVVDSPTPGQRVNSPIRVTGQAAVFEAVVSLTLYDANGWVIADQIGMTEEGQRLSPFTTLVRYAVTQDTAACLWVYARSAHDGSPINVVQVPLVLASAPGTTGVWLSQPPGSGSARSTCPESGQWLLLYWGGPSSPIDVAAEACPSIDRIWTSREGRWLGHATGVQRASDSWVPLLGEAHFLHRR